MKKQRSIIMTVYLYIFSLIGLVLIIFGAVGLIDLGLKATVFREADSQDRYYLMQPPQPYALERLQTLNESDEFSEKEKQTVQMWLEDYNAWKENQEKYDPVSAQRQRNAARNIALLIVGIPLYIFHWQMVRRD